MIKNNLNKKSRILCIDDSKLNRLFISKTLSTEEIIVDESENGLDGIKKIQENRYDLILVDIVMPVMDGFGFLEEFKSIRSDEFIPVILMTGLDDLNSKIKGLNIGADDYLMKPLNEKELRARVRSLLRLKKVNSELYEKNEQIKREMEAAKKIQQFIIPADFEYINYPAVSGKYLPIEDIGGDFFDCYQIDENRTAFLIADVTGHGIPAALTMTMSKMLFSIYAEKVDGPADLLRTINNQLRGALLDTQYITAFYLVYDDSTKNLTFSNAGHTRALYYRKSKNHVLALDSFGWFIGISDETDYEEKHLSVSEGDRLFIYTDGVTEIKNESGIEFGEVKLAKFIKDNKNKSGELFCDFLIQQLTEYRKNQSVNDDMAFLNIEF